MGCWKLSSPQPIFLLILRMVHVFIFEHSFGSHLDRLLILTLTDVRPREQNRCGEGRMDLYTLKWASSKNGKSFGFQNIRDELINPSTGAW
jgi:hypothetical protein